MCLSLQIRFFVIILLLSCFPIDFFATQNQRGTGKMIAIMLLAFFFIEGKGNRPTEK
ncbi:hypothetical protein BCV72DRAFT_230542 [Rhizopus microsporus var. microsporus]|uniref:Uncharacterized protein n=2 Tax=Rhizopus microsporus TaxID=58291 RepID=A0A2G4T487_RHIZD|nr:uncharacterized protein RHIMIDRAFT_273659 [Rhizopus microsporus ATCC 52813]ORE05119.1 hypothetical protein BCV72DRAFT_230542 [Rhizopus microsporus var. microsporus]PHZ15825.1 hypothetical protein RHIMIDRAFT_273659 [Rhizopus microsporus ATCC 52813]